MVKYAFMVFVQQTASSVFSEKSVESAAFIFVVLVMVDIGFARGGLGLTGGCGSGTVDGGTVINGTVGDRGLVIGTTRGTVGTRGIADDKEIGL